MKPRSTLLLRPLSHLLPPLPGLTVARTYAPGMVRLHARPCPIRRYAQEAGDPALVDRQTHEPGRHGGAVGRTALAVLHSLVFDFLNHRTGRLDPSYAAIARKAGVCVRAVSDALKKLRELGLLHRIRRCVEELAGRPVPAAPGDQRLPAAAGELLAGLEAAYGAARAPTGHLGRSDACANRRRPGGPGARSCGEGGGAQNRPGRRPSGRRGEPRGKPLEPTRIVVLPECRSCGETRPRLKTP